MKKQDRVRRRRILFFAEAVTLAHVMRPVMLAKTLGPVEYELWLACHPRYLKLFPDLPATHLHIDSISNKDFMTALAKGARIYNGKQLERYVAQDLELIDRIKPDLIIGDFRLSLAVSAPLRQIPYCTITNAYWSPYSHARTPIPEHPLSHLFGVVLAQQLFDLARPAVFAWHARPLNQLRKKHGLASLGHDLRRIYTWADHVFYADIPELASLGNLPPNHHFLGPLSWSPALATPSWWAKLPRDRPIIYLNLGSSGRNDLLPQILHSLSDLSVTVMAATLGNRIKDNAENLFLADYLPGDQAAARASLVICNGGSPATQQALAASVPVLGIVSNMDQHMNMAEIERFGAGRSLRSEKMTAEMLRRNVTQMLASPEYGAKAAEASRLYRHYRAEERFPALVNEILMA